MDIGTILSIGSTVMASRRKEGGGSGGMSALEAQKLMSTKDMRITPGRNPLEPAFQVSPPEQITYDQTRQFWASLLTDYLRG
jgi:hypothetical protein|tara:strand:+ start:330 stop:575 length:246 start_codon:yes stop_codon:yes gene_type:complete